MALRMGRSRLREHLARNGMDQVEFANRLGVSESFVSQLISQTSKFTYERAKNAADILDCAMEDLYEWEVSSPLGKRLKE